MIIYASGDSVVAGTELIDELFDGFPGYYKEIPDGNTITKNFIWKKNQTVPDNNQEKEISFPNLTAKHLGVEIINAGIPGASIERIVRNTIVDLIHLKKEHNHIIAVVGNTEAQRFDLPIDQDKWQSCFLTIPSENRYVEAIRNHKLKFETEYHRQIKFYEYIILLKDFCKINNIDLVLVDTLKYPLPFNKKFYDLNLYREYADITYAFSMNSLALRLEHRYCPQAHYSKYVHELASRALIKFLENKI